LLFSLSGCATSSTSTDKTPDNADYGPYPENFKEVVQKWAEENFQAATISDLQISQPVPGGLRPLRIGSGGLIYGWRTWVTLKGQHTDAGALATETHLLLIREGTVIHSEATEPGKLPEQVY
jgi:hypothetical protein